MLPLLTNSASQQELFDKGNRTFALLFTRWMDTNRWSHPVMVNLAKACMDGVGWLHSSQISGLRHQRLHSPGPRTFIAIERLNFYVHRYATTKTLLPNTSSSNFYAEAYAITENGEPPDLHEKFFSDDQAQEFSVKWAHMIRRLMTQRDIDLIVELERVVRENYPPNDAERVKQVLAVIQNRGTWTAAQLTNELPAIAALTAEMGGPQSESELLSRVQN
jgi:hypothetical protein